MSENQTQAAVAPAPVAKTSELQELATKAIRKQDHFPTIQDVAEAIVEMGFPIPDGKGPMYVSNKLVNMIEAGDLDDVLKAAAAKHGAAPKRRGSKDELGRAGHRILHLGVILRNGAGWRVCGKCTKDLSDERKLELHKLRLKGESWGELSKRFGLEYAHGMTARNIFLAIERAKKAKK